MPLHIPGLNNPDDDVFGGMIHPAYDKQKREDETLITESAIETASDDFAEQQLRAQSMAVGLAWLDMESPTGEDLEIIVEGVVSCSDDDDEDYELSDDELTHRNEIFESLEPIFESLGADTKNVQAALAGDEDAGIELGEHLQTLIGESTLSDDEVITDFAIKPALIGEGLKRVIRDGKVSYIRTNRRKKRMSAKQKAALKKARMKANTGAAKLARSKSNRMRKQRGL
jgi:hypothetical protein